MLFKKLLEHCGRTVNKKWWNLSLIINYLVFFRQTVKNCWMMETQTNTNNDEIEIKSEHLETDENEIRNDSRRHLFWGVFLYFLYVLLVSSCSPIFRSSGALSTPHALALLFVGEAASTTPLMPIARRNWTAKTPKQWAAFLGVGFIIHANFLTWRGSVIYLPLGSYAAIVSSGIFLGPLAASVVRRRCVDAADLAGAALAGVGVLLITRPSFLFGAEKPESPLGYFFAALAALCNAAYPFFYGSFAGVHWSNFFCLRLISGAIVAGACVAATGGVGWTSMPSHAVVSVLCVGAFSTIYRISQQFACQEMELFAAGTAGVLGNILTSGVIPVTAIMSVAMFGERLTPEETGGVVVVFVAIIATAVAKKLKKERGEERVEASVDAAAMEGGVGGSDKDIEGASCGADDRTARETLTEEMMQEINC